MPKINDVNLFQNPNRAKPVTRCELSHNLKPACTLPSTLYLTPYTLYRQLSDFTIYPYPLPFFLYPLTSVLYRAPNAETLPCLPASRLSGLPAARFGLGYLNPLQQHLNQIVGCLAFGLRLIADNYPMPQDIRGHCFDILGSYISSAV